MPSQLISTHSHETNLSSVPLLALLTFFPLEGVDGIHVFQFTSPPASGVTGTVPGAPDSIFLDLAEVLNDRITVDDVTTAIHTAWGTEGGKAGPEALRFHEETKLLIVSASPDRIAVAVNLVNLLQNRSTAARNSEAGRTISELKNQAERLEMKNQQLELEMVETRSMQRDRQQQQQQRIMELEIELAKLQQVK